ncbi:MAG: DUF4392 domain-containing protein [Sporomusaceae bacterium]|nr:DUF4392 domain-containing protein [Sporomusaceae bacterium]
MNETKLTAVAATLDRLSNSDVSGRGVIDVLYQAARQKAGEPVLLAAVKLLRQALQPGDAVVIATGWIDQPVVAPGCGESDGPAGAVALARALRLALKVKPVLVTTACLVPGMRQVARAAGFHCLEPELLQHSVERDKLQTLAVLPFPSDRESARQAAPTLLQQLRPAVCIAIECGGMSAAGGIHNMLGHEVSGPQAKLDYLFQEATRLGIITLAIGDGGNELGMANIAAAVQANLLPADRFGQVPATPVDLLLSATISNWGAYALAAALAAATGVTAAMNSPEQEQRVLTASADAGFHDPIYGAVAPSADGCYLDTHLAMVQLMAETVRRRL